MLMDYEIIENVSWCLIETYQRNMIVFVYRRRTVRELILTGGKVNGKHKGVVLVHGYVDLANQRAWLSF